MVPALPSALPAHPCASAARPPGAQRVAPRTPRSHPRCVFASHSAACVVWPRTRWDGYLGGSTAPPHHPPRLPAHPGGGASGSGRSWMIFAHRRRLLRTARVRNDFPPDTGFEFFKDVPQSPFSCDSSCDVRSGGRSQTETPASPNQLGLPVLPSASHLAPGSPESPSRSVRTGAGSESHPP